MPFYEHEFHRASERMIRAAKSSVQGASILLQTQQVLVGNVRTEKLRKLYHSIEKDLTEVETVMGNYLWKEDKGLDSRSARLTGPHRSNKRIRTRPSNAHASTSEVPETPPTYPHLSRRNESLPSMSMEKVPVTTRVGYPYERRSVHRTSPFPLITQNATHSYSLPHTPTRARHTPRHKMPEQHVPSEYSKTETEPPSPIGPSRAHQIGAALIAIAPNSDESVTEPETE
ncbi:hypothetical protein NLI96_g12783 [Meripilus lineatus]|uniref:Uncharacterized protein n=1 Tax=Meripilus lineatus TaxID=2056292 RepID=A0AAD5UP83_9APHY|nr:hypothetical protein NLI96_g12783 [Physisporinus lineatus]